MGAQKGWFVSAPLRLGPQLGGLEVARPEKQLQDASSPTGWLPDQGGCKSYMEAQGSEREPVMGALQDSLGRLLPFRTRGHTTPLARGSMG